MRSDPEASWKTTWVECECHTHAISVSSYDDDDTVYLSVWGFSEMNHDSYGDRIRRAWHALRGSLHLDNVCLDPEETRKLREALEA